MIVARETMTAMVRQNQELPAFCKASKSFRCSATLGSDPPPDIGIIHSPQIIRFYYNKGETKEQPESSRTPNGKKQGYCPCAVLNDESLDRQAPEGFYFNT